MKVLIIRFSSIGDIVLTTPVVRAVKQQLGAEVHYVTKSSFKNLLEPNPYIDKIHELEDHMGSLLHKLKKEKFDLILDMHKNLRSRRIKNALKTKYLSFDKINIAKWLIVNLKIDRLPDVHIVDRYFQGFKSIGIKNDGDGLDFFYSNHIDKKAKAIELPKSPFIVIVLGATYYTKRIPIATLKKMIENSKSAIVLIGGKDVIDISSALLKCANYELIYDFCGKVDIETSANIMSQATEIITADTGMMHIAAALQKPIKSVWGNTIPKFGMNPYYGDKNINRNTNIEVLDLACRPCSKIGFDKCPKGHFKCMTELPYIHC